MGLGPQGAPLRLRVYVTSLALAALVGVWIAPPPAVSSEVHADLILLVLIAVSAFQVEFARYLSTRFGYSLPPHSALSTWALASALLLPAPWLLLVVSLTSLHVCLRDPAARGGFRWVPSSFERILCGIGASAALAGAHGLFDLGDRVVVDVLIGVVGFLILEIALRAVAQTLRIGGVRWWVHGRRLSPAGLASESIALVGGGLFAAVWTLGMWLAVFLTLGCLLIQNGQLVLPLRSRSSLERRLVAENAKLAGLVDSLSSQNSELDDLIRFKSDLIGMLGHEISNPLTAVLGFTQIGRAAAAEGDAESAEVALGTVERNARKVADVVMDIRGLVASERGGITAVPEPVRLAPRLRAAIDDRSRGRRPLLTCPSDVVVMIQPGHLDQIMANLLSNATKYGGGATEVSVETVGSLVTISVIDTGAGVPAGSRERLFERYFRDDKAARQMPGTGIGLFISRELARANDGDLWHEPTEPAGSTFVLSLGRYVASSAGDPVREAAVEV